MSCLKRPFADRSVLHFSLLSASVAVWVAVRCRVRTDAGYGFLPHVQAGCSRTCVGVLNALKLPFHCSPHITTYSCFSPSLLSRLTALANSSKGRVRQRGRGFATLGVSARSNKRRRRAMSMRPQEINPVPEETAHVARAANPQGNTYMNMRDELGSIYQDQMCAALFPRRGQPAEAPWRLALVTVMQYMEGLSDRQAAEAVRERIDWKYALSLELTDPGFDFVRHVTWQSIADAIGT